MIHLLCLFVEERSESLDSVFMLINVIYSNVISLHCSMLMLYQYMCDYRFERGSLCIRTLLYRDTSQFQHKEINLGRNKFRVPKVFNIFLLRSFIFLPTFHYYLCFILYYFITSYFINIKNCHNKVLSEYRPRFI